MAGRNPQRRPCGILQGQKGKKQQRAPVAHRAPPAEEEDPRVKCKDCGAFGHKASSVRCPMKLWQGALAPQALGSNRTKENLKPRTPQDLQNPGPFTTAERQKEPSPRREEQQTQALLQRFPRRPQGRPQHNWKESTESCDYVRHPNRPMPVYTTKRKGVLDPDLTSRSPPTRKPDMTSMASPTRRPECSNLPPSGLNKGQRVPITGVPHPACKHFVQDPSHIVQQRDTRPLLVSLGNPQAAHKTHGLGYALIPQAQAKMPVENSHTIRYGAAHNWGQDSTLSIKAPGKRAAQTSIETGHNHQKKLRRNPFQTPQRSMERPDLGVFPTLHSPASPTGPRPAVAAQVPMITPAQEHSIAFQPPRKGPHLKTVQACHDPQPPPPDQVSGQSLRMVFTRSDRGQWSSRFMTAPSFPPAQKSGSPGQSPAISEKSEGHWTHVPWSVLYDDLQVSSSSEESDGQGVTPRQ
ncbi:protein FAM90A13-like [Hipposideros larvatus]